MIDNLITPYLKQNRWATWVLTALAIVFTLSITQTFARPVTEQLTSSDTWTVVIGWSIPIMFAAFGGIFAERAGVINIGLEGMMIFGTWFSAWGAFEFGPWWGLLIGGLGGALGGLLHAVATVSFGVDHIVSGVAINLTAMGAVRFLSEEIFANLPGGGTTQSPRVEGTPELDLPFFAGGQIPFLGWDTPDILGRIESWNWFFLSDIAGILRGITGNLSWFTIFAWLSIPFIVWLLWRTAFGLRLRSCGEHPVAADSLGINVYRYKYYGVIISGFLSGLGGSFLVLELTGIYREGQTNGRGFIGLAAMIFGNWKPVGSALGSLLFGFTDILQLRDTPAAHALLLQVTLLLLIAVLVFALRKRLMVASYAFAGAAIFFVWYVLTETVPKELPPVIPHFTVLFVLVIIAARLRGPLAAGMQYRRGQQE